MPAGATFTGLEMVYSVYTAGDLERFANVFEAMQLLEDDYLGGQGSRGSGKIRFEGLTVYHAHNAYFKMWARYAGLPGNPAMRTAAWMESIRVRNYEARVGKAVDLVFAAPNDARELIVSGVSASSSFTAVTVPAIGA